MIPTNPTTEPTIDPTMEPSIRNEEEVGNDPAQNQDSESGTGTYLSTGNALLLGFIVGLVCIICGLLVFIIMYRRQIRNKKMQARNKTVFEEVMVVSPVNKMVAVASNSQPGQGQPVVNIEMNKHGECGEETDGDNDEETIPGLVRTPSMDRQETGDTDGMFGTIEDYKTPGFCDDDIVAVKGGQPGVYHYDHEQMDNGGMYR